MRRINRRLVLSGWIAATLVGSLTAQTARPRFEVASIRTFVPGSPVASVTGGTSPAPGGAFNRVVTIAGLILYAYDLLDYQLQGGPDWVRTERVQIAARAGREVTTDELRLMLQSLLEERFQLVLRPEQREVTRYALVRARVDGRLGPNIAENTNDCKQRSVRPSNVPQGASLIVGCGGAEGIARVASRVLQAPVVDNTGLTGMFEYFVYSADTPMSFAGVAVRAPDVAVDPNAPPFPTALQEQLGLKLESSRGAADIFVVESVEPPSAN